MSKKNLNKFLKAFLVATCLTIIFAFAAPLFIAGSFADFGIIIGAALLFLGTIPLYYLFTYLQSIHQQSWFYGGITFIIVYAVAVNSDVNIFVDNLLNSEKIPSKYMNYHDIRREKITHFANYEMKLRFISSEPISHFISSKKNLIVITAKIPTDRDQFEVKNDGHGQRLFLDYTHHKLGANAKIIDQYVFKQTSDNVGELLFGDFIVNDRKGYYKTWVSDGDQKEKPLIILNKELNWNKTDQKVLLKKIIREAVYYKLDRFYNEVGGKIAAKVIIYFSEDKWFKLYLDELPEYDNAVHERGETTYLNNIFGNYEDYQGVVKADWIPFQPEYFQRIKKSDTEVSFRDDFRESNQINWRGNLYCRLLVDRDTLHFLRPISFGKGGQTSQFYNAHGDEISKFKKELEEYYHPYFYYSNPVLDFKLFTLRSRELYIITSK